MPTSRQRTDSESPVDRATRWPLRATLLFLGLIALLGLWLTQAAAAQSPGDASSSTPLTERSVRVRIMAEDAPATATVTAPSAPLRLSVPGRSAALMQVPAGQSVEITRRNREIVVRTGQDGLYASALRVATTNGSSWRLTTPSIEETRRYAGTLEVKPDSARTNRLQLVNDVPLDAYVASVIASEYALDDTEGRKAMAVVARTYALRSTEKFGPDYMVVDNTASQVYHGAGTVTTEAQAAAKATTGEVLTHDGALIDATYYASSGGHTASNEDVWDADSARPYLRGKPDPYDKASPYHDWRATMKRSTLLDALSAHYGFTVDGFYLGERSPDGRVQTIELKRTNGRRTSVQANEFRLVANRAFSDAPLKSTMIDVRLDGNRYVVEGHGYGHGVGMSQWGAHEMAKQGHSYREILQFYYTDVTLRSLEGAEIQPQPALADRRAAGAKPQGKQQAASSKKKAQPAETTQTETKETSRRVGW
jgi:stage II sporulation protein D